MHDMVREADPASLPPFAAPVGRLTAPFEARLSERLATVDGLSTGEPEAFAAAGRAALRTAAQLKLNRLLLLELNAASLTGALAGAGPEERWAAFLELAASPAFDLHLQRRYPSLHTRLATVCGRQVQAVETLAGRFARDRRALAALPGAPREPVTVVALGVGDSHRGGQTVARLEAPDGAVMYKPRPVQVDAALERLLAQVLGSDAALRIRVPRVLVREGYGWSEFVAHRYCAVSDELRVFHRNVGHWLAIMRLVAGTDMHSENLVANGAVPALVDVESLFTPDDAVPPTGRGQAVDIAARAVRRTVLRTGLLPSRARGLALGGADISGAGALPGQQPGIPAPVIVGAGTDRARFEMATFPLAPSGNQPSPTPVLAHYWSDIEAGFRELTAELQRLDRAGCLEPLLQPFVGCEVRRIPRSTQAYVEIGRMLWHPASLHDQPAAVERARDVLRRNAAASPGASDDDAIIQREIEELLAGDVPVFTVTVDDALLRASVDDWRSADLALEELTIRGALVSAYLNEYDLPLRERQPSRDPSRRDLEPRRRRLAAALVRELCNAGVRAPDGTWTWVSPVLTDIGWVIRPLTADLYSGQNGVALCLAAYVHEQRLGHVEGIDEVEAALDGTLAVLCATEDGVPMPLVGGFMGLASQVWTWMALHELLHEPRFLARARERAEALAERLQEDDRHLEVLGGAAGAIVPLLNLVEQTGEARWRQVAFQVADQLQRRARHDDRGASWVTPTFPDGIGGFAHGATGIGWALARLGLAGGGDEQRRRVAADLAERAFAFEHSLYRADAGAWIDLRKGGESAFSHAWCHGSMGIGMAAADLYWRTGDARWRTILRRACAAAQAYGFGWSHTLCHGDLGLWELLECGRRVDPEGGWIDREVLDAEILTGLEERGPIGGLARDAFTPGLMPGLAGVVLVLLRMHSAARLPSPLLLGRTGEL